MPSSSLGELQFYDGRYYAIDTKRMHRFEYETLIERFYKEREMEQITVMQELGSVLLDYTNSFDWGKEIPDIDPRSARIFIIWAEDVKTRKIIVLLRGFFFLVPISLGEDQLYNYYFMKETVPYYPVALISSFRTSIQDKKSLNDLLIRVKQEINNYWRKLRAQVIKTLDEDSNLRKRYKLSVEEVMNYCFICPSIDREVIGMLKNNKYQLTGFMQILTSPTTEYEAAKMEEYMREGRRLIEEQKKIRKNLGNKEI